MKKLFVLILLGMVFFIGGQWIGLEVQHRKTQQGPPQAPPSGDASPMIEAPLQPLDSLPSTTQ